MKEPSVGRTLLDAEAPHPDAQAGDMLFGAPVDPVQTSPLADAAAQDAASKKLPANGNTVEGDTGGGKGAAIVAAAKSQLGVKYVYGAHQWGQAVDCSGLTQGAAAHAGIQVGGNTYTQVTQGTAVDGGLANAQPGDFVFTTGDIGMRKNGHVGIYIGNGMVIAAPHTGAVVAEQDWSSRPITAIRRYT